MPNQQERRINEREPCRLACTYELMKPVDSSTMTFSMGQGHSINCSSNGMLLMLPDEVDQRQVFEIQVPSEARATQITKLGEVRWTRSILVNARVCMHVVGIRFLFELPPLG